MQRVYREYERRKAAEGLIDFEDLLELAVRMFEQNAEARETFRAQYRAFTVDEYQDVNLLQQKLLDLWLGERDDLCVVGDDYQSIYAFTGASPDHLLGVPQRFPHALVVRLEENYRSTPQVLALANRLVPNLGGAEKTLRPTLPDGAEPVVRPFASPEDEGAAIVAEIRALGLSARGDRDPRAHERAPDRLRGAAARGRHPVPGRVAARARCGAPDHAAARAHLGAARPRPCAPRRSRPAGSSALPDKLGEREAVRQQDLARLVQLAAEFDGDAASFVADLRRRFDSGGDGARGVNLLTLHRAKGLEFDAVFIPRLQEKELPSKQARTPAEIAEERRLLYVGMTRAKRVLWLTWSGKRSRFLPELGVTQTRRRAGASASGRPTRRSCATGGSSVRRPTASRRTSSSTTACCTRSPTRARRRSASCRRSRASARRSSSATATSCSRSIAYVERRQQQVEHQLRVAAHARRRSCGRASAARARAGR